MDHNYDGIRELDNPLPGWWLVTFFGTIIFAFIYWLHYDVAGTGKLNLEVLKEDMAHIEQLRQKAEAEGPKFDNETLSALMQDPQALAKGGQEYASKCAACHGSQGEGLIGPNLTDSYWIHYKGELSGIAQVINEGVLDKGMPAWKGLISPPMVANVTAFVGSLKGKNLPGKEPQGEDIR